MYIYIYNIISVYNIATSPAAAGIVVVGALHAVVALCGVRERRVTLLIRCKVLGGR